MAPSVFRSVGRAPYIIDLVVYARARTYAPLFRKEGAFWPALKISVRPSDKTLRTLNTDATGNQDTVSSPYLYVDSLRLKFIGHMGLGLVGISRIWLFVHEISALLMLRPLFENSQGNSCVHRTTV